MINNSTEAQVHLQSILSVYSLYQGRSKDYRFQYSLLTSKKKGSKQMPGLLDLQMRQLRERIKELHASHEAQINIVVEKYQQLKTQINDYHQSLFDVMDVKPDSRDPTATLS